MCLSLSTVLWEFCVFYHRGKMLRSKHRPVERKGMAISFTLQFSFTWKMCSLIPCSANNVSQGWVRFCCSTVKCTQCPLCHVPAMIKTSLLPFCCHFSLEIGNPISLFQQCELVASFFYASFILHQIICLSIGQL